MAANQVYCAVRSRRSSTTASSVLTSNTGETQETVRRGSKAPDQVEKPKVEARTPAEEDKPSPKQKLVVDLVSRTWLSPVLSLTVLVSGDRSRCRMFKSCELQRA